MTWSRGQTNGSGWELSVADNGAGKPASAPAPAETGAGTGIIAALVKELDARIESSTGPDGSGTAVTITAR